MDVNEHLEVVDENETDAAHGACRSEAGSSKISKFTRQMKPPSRSSAPSSAGDITGSPIVRCPAIVG
jgi:hypothetical protein